MNKLKVAFLFCMILLIISCNQKPSAITPNEKNEVAMKLKATLPRFTPEMVVNKKDFICGMPVKAGIEDTAHVNGKVYGFCSKECKDEFLKNPNAYLQPIHKSSSAAKGMPSK